MNRILRLRDGSALNTIGLVALAVLALTIVLAVLVIMPVYSMYKSPPKLSTSARATAQAVDKFHDSMTRSVAMVDGRSWFFEPKPPEATVEKPRVPAKYSGPQLTHIINGTAWFADGQKISPSEPKSKSLELVKSNAPWSITVKWEGGEFEVELFKRVDLLSMKDGAGFTSSYPAATASFGAKPPEAAATNSRDTTFSNRPDLPVEARLGPGVALPAPGTPTSSEAPVPPQTAPAPSAPPAPPPTSDPTQPAPAAPPSPAPPPTDPPKEPPSLSR